MGGKRVQQQEDHLKLLAQYKLICNVFFTSFICGKLTLNFKLINDRLVVSDLPRRLGRKRYIKVELQYLATRFARRWILPFRMLVVSFEICLEHIQEIISAKSISIS